jgi:hypothetical protein
MTYRIPNTFEPNFLQALDGRTNEAAMLRARWQAIMDDMGGADQTSYMTRLLAERLVWSCYWLEQEEVKQLKSGQHDQTRIIAATNAMLGICNKLAADQKDRFVVELDEAIANQPPIGWHRH